MVVVSVVEFEAGLELAGLAGRPRRRFPYLTHSPLRVEEEVEEVGDYYLMHCVAVDQQRRPP